MEANALERELCGRQIHTNPQSAGKEVFLENHLQRGRPSGSRKPLPCPWERVRWNHTLCLRTRAGAGGGGESKAWLTVTLEGSFLYRNT